MKLIRKWNPNDAPGIKNPGGPNNYRLVALVKDDTYTHYAVFFDMWTGKIYAELIRQKHAAQWDYSDFWQIENDQEWNALINYLQEDGVEVIQMVESKIEKGMKEMAFHENLNKLPRVSYGVDANGSQVITGESDISMQMSPSLIGVD
jgi:L-rhamnose mutarotase